MYNIKYQIQNKLKLKTIMMKYGKIGINVFNNSKPK